MVSALLSLLLPFRDNITSQHAVTAALFQVPLSVLGKVFLPLILTPLVYHTTPGERSSHSPRFT